jgi:hypothetical protein
LARRTVRIAGLVRTMTEVRSALSDGIPLSEAENFRGRVRATLRMVERTCVEQGVTPRCLPAPSRRAYQYLRRLNLQELPLRPDGEAPPRRVRVANLQRLRLDIQDRLRGLAQDENLAAGQQVLPSFLLADLHGQILDQVAEIAWICYRAGSTPASLSRPARRAYQWLSFLSDRRALEDHLETLRQAMKVDRRVKVDLYNFSGLFRYWREDGRVHVTMHEAFAGAPQPVIEALIRTTLPYARRSAHQKIVMAYAESEEYLHRSMAIESSGGAAADEPRGRYYDLEAVFHSVNDDYFGGRLRRPRLTWSEIPTGFEFGYYQPSTNTLMVSLSLDAPHIPAYVVEHVMHHELLHMQLGIEISSTGRRRAHTASFRQLERQFRDFQAADVYLQNLATRL